MLTVLALVACSSDPIPPAVPGTARVVYTARGEGEIEPCG